MKIKTNNTKNGVTSTIKLALHKDLTLKTPKIEQESDYGGGSKKNYIWRSIMKAVTFYF